MSKSTNSPAKKYATVLVNGESTEWPTKAKAIAYGESTGESFTVLSPRGSECHVHTVEPKPEQEKPAGRTKYVAPEWRLEGEGRIASELAVGDVAISTAARTFGQEFTIAKVTVGKKIVRAWDKENVLRLYAPRDARL